MRYEIVDRGGFFRYTVYAYEGDAVYPWGRVVHVAATRAGARRIAKKDAKRESRRTYEGGYPPGSGDLVETIVV